MGMPGGIIHGFYSRIRSLSSQIKMDQEHLDRAPLGPVAKKRLQERIDSSRSELKKVRAKFRAYKARVKKK